MPNEQLDELDASDATVLALGTAYPPRYHLHGHTHRRAQLLYARRGVMTVRTEFGDWTVPPRKAVLIAAGVVHEVVMLDTQTESLYIEPTAVPWWPATCAVVAVSPLLAELLHAAAGADPRALSSRDEVVLSLILHELAGLAPLPLHVGVPGREPFRTLCLDYLERADNRVTTATWARQAAMSERAFSRGFMAELGMSPSAWRLRARVLAALPMLRERSVSDVATQLGYATPAAFTAAFSAQIGQPPSAFRNRVTSTSNLPATEAARRRRHWPAGRR